VWGLAHLEDPDTARALFDRLHADRADAPPVDDPAPAQELALATSTSPDERS